MTTQTEALKLALEALENLINQHYAETTTNDDLEKADNAITAIKDVLEAHKALVNHIPDAKNMVEQPAVASEQEPVAWVSEIAEEAELMLEKPRFRAVALYTTPPTQCNCSQRPSRSDMAWVELTDEDWDYLNKYCGSIRSAIQTAETLLKEKNT